jgi:hypothetical protein
VEPPLARQHFFQFCGVVALGFIGCAEIWQAFFSVFEPRITWIALIPKTRSRDLSIPAALESYQLATMSR